MSLVNGAQHWQEEPGASTSVATGLLLVAVALNRYAIAESGRPGGSFTINASLGFDMAPNDFSGTGILARIGDTAVFL